MRALLVLALLALPVLMAIAKKDPVGMCRHRGEPCTLPGDCCAALACVGTCTSSSPDGGPNR